MKHFSLVRLALALVLFVASSQSQDFEITADTSLAIAHVNNAYVSWTIDAIALGHNFSDPVLIKVASHLSPAVFRMGGTAADHLTYAMNETAVDSVEAAVLTAGKWDQLHNFVKSIGGVEFVFGINGLTRTTGGPWDPTNAQTLIEYTIKKGYEMFGWELGNEPNIFPSPGVTPEQLAKDFATFSELLDKLYANQAVPKPKIVGPDVCCEFYNENYLLNFLNATGCAHLDVLTWHFYPIDGHTAKLEYFLDPTDSVDRIRQNRYAPGAMELFETFCSKDVELWIGETSSAWGGGAPGLSDTFVNGFWWLDELAYSATQKDKVLLRQDLLGGTYGLIQEKTWIPNPDYWTAVLWKKLIANGVLTATVTPASHVVRAYAMCGQAGSVVFIVLNMNATHANVKINAEFGTSFEVFLLTAREVTAQTVMLNGVELSLDANHELPQLDGKQVNTNTIELPPYSYGFIVSRTQVKVCEA